MSQSTTAAVPSALTAATPGSLPATYVETDPAQCDQAKIAHLCGIFGILGTGIYYFIKRGEAGTFAKDQMKEAFNFHLLVFCVAIVMSIVSAVAAAIVGVLGMLVSLATMVLMIGAIVLSVMNGLKAGKGEVARYPARIRVLK